jgi:hypothetical protein
MTNPESERGSGIVKKTAANALMLFVVAQLFVCLAMPVPQATLPACCRPDGKHHCAILAVMEERSKDAPPSVQDLSLVCPSRTAVATPSARNISGPPVRVVLVQTFGELGQVTRMRVGAGVSELRSYLERGPPGSSLS